MGSERFAIVQQTPAWDVEEKPILGGHPCSQSRESGKLNGHERPRALLRLSGESNSESR